jgi:ribonuclease Z
LSTFNHLGREEALHVCGPRGLKALMDAIMHYTHLNIKYPLEIMEYEPSGLEKIQTMGNLEVFTFPLHHRIPCNGYVFREKKAMLKLNKEKIQQLALLPEQIRDVRDGKDIEKDGRNITNSSLTIGPREPLSYAYCSDTRFDPRIGAWLKPVTVIYHETTFEHSLKDLADETGHSTALEAAKTASAAGAQYLMTGHYSSRYKSLETIMAEAKEHFPNVLESVEGKRYDLRKLIAGIE